MVVYDLKEDYKISKLCKYLKVSTSGYYRWLKRGRPIRYKWDEWLADNVNEKFTKNVTEIFTSFVNQICPVTPSTHPSCDMIYP